MRDDQVIDFNSILFTLEAMFKADDDVACRIHGVNKSWLEAYERLREITTVLRRAVIKSDEAFGIKWPPFLDPQGN